MPRHGGISKQEQAKDFKGSIKKLLFSLKKYNKILVITIILSILSSIFSIIAPNKLSDMTNLISEAIAPNINETRIKEFMSDPKISQQSKNELMIILSKSDNKNMIDKYDSLPSEVKNYFKNDMNISKIKKIALFLSIIYILSATFSFIVNYIMAGLSNKYAKDLRNKLTIKINKLPLKYFDNNKSGDILSRVTNDIDTLSQALSQSVGSLISALTLFISCIIMMFYTNYIMAITAILSSLIGFLFMASILSKSQKYFSLRQENLGKVNGHIEESYSSFSIVNVYNAKKETISNFDKLNNELYTSVFKSAFLSGLMQPLMIFVGSLGYVCVAIVGSLLVIKGSISFGVIVAFIVYVRLFTNPLSTIAQGMTLVQSAASASERVFEFLEEKELSDESNMSNKISIDKIKGNIEFKDVKFGYNSNKTIIKNLNLQVKKGQKIAIVGPTGAGKTTIVNLLMKFYEINSGSIKIDGIDINELTRENIHDLFTMVLQDTWLFNGTILENIIFNKENITEDKVKEVCSTIGLDHFIKSLPLGYNSIIDDSNSISSGQKQLLTIARGMLNNTPLLILDEATSSVDTRTEILVQNAMDKLMENKTSFIIAHRLSTIKNADLILVMQDGDIIEKGTHDELMNQNGFYEKLYTSQFEKI